MDLEQINTEHLVPRYLAGQLTAADEAAFEAYAAENPQVYRDIERVLRLKEGLAVLQNRKQLAPLVQSRSWRAYLPLATAAAVIVLSCGVFLWTQHRQASPIVLAAATTDFAPSRSKSSPVVGSYVLLRSRNAGNTAPIDLPIQRGIAQLRILPDTLGDPPYTARLIRLSPRGPDPVAETTGLLASPTDFFVTVYIDTNTLTSGEYEIVLAPHTASPDSNRDHFKLHLP